MKRKPGYALSPANFRVIKSYGHALGFSCAFRQWRADSHCRFLHGYALRFDLTFSARELDKNGWVIDFGSLKQVKEFLEKNFDHKTIVAHDDPEQSFFEQAHERGLIDRVIMQRTGCEFFAAWVGTCVKQLLEPRVTLESVQVHEHAGNSVIWLNPDVLIEL